MSLGAGVLPLCVPPSSKSDEGYQSRNAQLYKVCGKECVLLESDDDEEEAERGSGEQGCQGGDGGGMHLEG